jgi:DNA-binding ferritin-like protein (Dps family)
MAFCDDLIREWKSRTWQGDMRAKFNDRIHKQLKGLEGKI